RWTSTGVKGEIWRDVLGTYRAIPGYTVAAQLVFAKDYGVPQNRPRILLVGIRNDVGNGLLREGADEEAVARGYLPHPSPGLAPDLIDVLGDLVDPDHVNGGVTASYPLPAWTPIQKYFRMPSTGGRPLGEGAPVTEHQYSKHSPAVIAKFEAMHRTGGIVPERFKTRKFAQRLLPPRWGPAGPTITATSLPDDYVHFEQPRTLTVREWARLQMFPDWYQFAGKRTTGGIKRAGNP